MERNAEYLLLKEELNHTPGDLEFTLSHACARLRQKKRLRMINVPARAILALVVAFVLLVNLSWSFALACSRLPVLSDLAAAVALSPSLKAAVENGYVQYLNMEQTRNDLTMKLEYLVVDQKQVNIYYRLYNDAGKDYNIYSDVIISPRGIFHGLMTSDTQQAWENSDGLGHIRLEFGSIDVPGALTLLCDAEEPTIDLSLGENQRMKFAFYIEFDPNFTRKAEVYTPNQSFTFHGQTFTVASVEVFPTQMRVNLLADESNTAWIRALYCYAEDENGVRYEPSAEGLTVALWDITPMRNGFRLESAYFGEGKKLTLHILGVALLDKDAPSIKIDLQNNTAQGLPDGITFAGTEQKDELVGLHFSVHRIKDLVYRNEYGEDFSLDWRYYSISDPTVIEDRHIIIMRTEYDPQTQEEVYTVDAGDSSVVYLLPAYSELVAAQSPI
ncbi:MAG TPA: DUF4179 domain-containing protein, partial [Clostridia bacterium]|nr:DUF4179 domain-containing protein [Clostridia bacterium]